MKRSGKWYRKNEASTMRSLGLQPTPNSGSGWVVKEDGQSEDLICQLKSTDASSIRINKQDLDTLEHNAQVAHKVPVFAIQFIGDGQVYLVIKPLDLEMVQKYIKTGENDHKDFLGIDESELEEAVTCPARNTIRSSSSARERFRVEQQNKYKKERSAK